MNIIEIKNVTKDYPLGKTLVRALRGIDLSIKKGTMLGVVGPSGSGKTTLLNIIGCIDQPTTGEIIVSGQDVTKLSDKHLSNVRLHKIGFIFQTFNLIPVLNVYENIEFPLLLMKHLPRNKVKEKVNHLIEAVGLTEHIKHKPAELSGGQRQRVAIARALVTNPDIVLADEPTANLDSATGESILQVMRTMNDNEKTTFIFSTHDHHVLKYAQQVVKIHDGLIEKDLA